MDKIYSRKKIKIPKFNIFFSRNQNKFKNRKIKKIFTFIILVFVIYLTIKTIVTAVLPTYDALCQTEAKSLATLVTNEQVAKVMENYNYNDLIEIIKDNDGNVKMLNANIVNMNKISSEISVKIQNTINHTDIGKIYIKLGSFTGNPILSGRGPNVKILVSSIGNIDITQETKFQSVGINQTMHRMYLDIKCKIGILTPFKDIYQEIENKVLLAENIIVGLIPETYYNLQGISVDDAIQMME